MLFLSSAGTLRRAALPASHRAWRGAATAHPHATHPKQACGWHNGVQTMPYGRVGFRPEVTGRGLGIKAAVPFSFRSSLIPLPMEGKEKDGTERRSKLP